MAGDEERNYRISGIRRYIGGEMVKLKWFQVGKGCQIEQDEEGEKGKASRTVQEDMGSRD